MPQAANRWVIDPDDPRAPPQEVWAQLETAERRRIVDELPSEFPASEASPPEGDHHQDAVDYTRQALRMHFRRLRRRVNVGNDLPVYYPGERMFSPDLLAVLDAGDQPRDRWVVSAEGKGLDLALEVHWLGHRLKDVDRNTEWYARLGIAEYFVVDLRRLRLLGFRLPSPEAQRYQPLLPQGGRFASSVLGLDLGLEGDRLRFFAGAAALPDAGELVSRLDLAMASLVAKAEEDARKAEEALGRADREAQARREAEQRVAELQAEIERLRGGR